MQLTERGMVRFEVIDQGMEGELVRVIVRRLPEDDSDTESLRAAIRQTISGEPPKKGGIVKRSWHHRLLAKSSA